MSPSAANNNQAILVTYNNGYAAHSVDYGSSWTYLDSQVVVDPGTLWGDQEVMYDPSRDLTFWLIMDQPFWDADSGTTPPNNDGNTLHLLIFVGSSNLIALNYLPFEIDPKDNCIGGQDEDYYTSAHMSLSSNYLNLATNVSRKSSDDPDEDVYICTSMARFSLDSLPVSLTYDIFSSDNTLFNFTSAKGSAETFYFATHQDADTLLVYRWPEFVGGPDVDTYVIDHLAYVRSRRSWLHGLRLQASRRHSRDQPLWP